MTRLGVDLGTTWTAAAFLDGAAATPVKLGSSGAAMPSVVAIVDGRPVAGEAAVRAGREAPTSVAREFKRRLGDDTPIVLGATPYAPETLTGHLLAHVVASAGGATSVALTHPATWGEFKLDLLREAGRVAGLSDIDLVPEPIAAAGHYARLGRLASDDAVAVYDFGGGTFDVAVVRLTPGGPELVGRAEGLDRLGGVDLDQAVLAHVDATLDGALRAMVRDDPDVRRAAFELRAECIAAKETLSADTDATIAVRFPSLTTEVRITRAEFEAAVRPRVAETLTTLDRAIASASLTVGELAGVVLIGGSSRIPLVAEQVAAHTGRPNLVDADPKFSVAFGAAEPHLRPQAGRPTPPVPVAATVPTEAAMPDSTRSTPPPPPGPIDEAGKVSAAAKVSAPPKPSERRTAAGNAPKEQTGMSTAKKAAAGVAAAGAATAAAVLWGDQVTDALGITDADADVDASTSAEAVAETPAADESMDAFDAGAGGGGGGGASGGGGGGGFAPPQARPRVDLPPPVQQSQSSQQQFEIAPEFLNARAELLQQLEAMEFPDDVDPVAAAELKERLAGIVERARPLPGQSTEDAVADLREEFRVRIDVFQTEQRQERESEDQPEAESEGGPETESEGGTTGDESGEGTGDEPGDQPGDGTGGQSGDGTGDDTGDQSGEGTGDETGDQSGEGTGETGHGAAEAAAAERFYAEKAETIRGLEFAIETEEGSFNPSPERLDSMHNRLMQVRSAQFDPTIPEEEWFDPHVLDEALSERLRNLVDESGDETVDESGDRTGDQPSDDVVIDVFDEIVSGSADQATAVGDATVIDHVVDPTVGQPVDATTVEPLLPADAGSSDVLGEELVMEDVLRTTEIPALDGEPLEPAYDLGLDVPVLVDTTVDELSGPEVLTFEEPTFEPEPADLGAPEFESEPEYADTTPDDDLGLG